MIINIRGDTWHKDVMINHFGINPVRGGMPLSERSIIGMISCIIAEDELILLNCLLFCWLKKLIIINSGIIIDEYII